MIPAKKSLESKFVIVLNLRESNNREKSYQQQFEAICEEYTRDFPEFEAERERNRSTSHRSRIQFSSTAARLGVALLQKRIEIDRIQADIAFEKRRSTYLNNKAIEVGLWQWAEDFFQKFSDEMRILIYDGDDRFILSFKRVPDGSICPKGYEEFFPSLGICFEIHELPISKNENSKTRKYKITSNLLHIDYEACHPILRKNCHFCKRTFYTLNNIVKYCCPECKDNAYDLCRRKGRKRRIQGEAVNICPECGDIYPGNARTCNKSKCKKRDYRRRKKQQLH